MRRTASALRQTVGLRQARTQLITDESVRDTCVSFLRFSETFHAQPGTMPVTFTPLRTLTLNETETIFDLQFHPEKDRVLVAATVEGDVLM